MDLHEIHLSLAISHSFRAFVTKEMHFTCQIILQKRFESHHHSGDEISSVFKISCSSDKICFRLIGRTLKENPTTPGSTCPDEKTLKIRGDKPTLS